MTRNGEETKKRKLDGDKDNQSDTEMNEEKIDVTFEFCDLNPIDYHAIKHLISQLFRIARPGTGSTTNSTKKHDKPPQKDDTSLTTVRPSKAPLKPVLEGLDVGELADIILGDQKEWVGCTVKCDEQDCDPYAFISVLDLVAHQTKPSIVALTEYLSSVLASSTNSAPQAQELLEILNDSLKPDGKGIGLVLSERLINMPVQVMPQLFSQLGNEIKHAQSKNAPGFGFDKLLIPSRVFLIPSTEDSKEEINPSFEPPTHSPKSKKNKTEADVNCDENSNEIGLYHPEDQIISQFASHTIHYSLTNSSAEKSGLSAGKEEFGIEQQGRLMLIEISKWDKMVASLKDHIENPDQVQVS